MERKLIDLLLTPIAWFVRLLSFLPDALRVAGFLAATVLIVGFLLRGGLRGLWNGVCRWFAVLVAVLVAAALRVELTVTRARRRQGNPPFAWTVTAAEPIERFIDALRRLWEGHRPRERGHWKPRLPWILAGAIAVISMAVWVGMGQADERDGVAHQLSRGFQHWRDFEGWAGVPPERRAEPGPTLLDDGTPPVPRIVRVRRERDSVQVRLRCGNSKPCRGSLHVRGRRGTGGAKRPVLMASSSRTTVRIPMSRPGRVSIEPDR